MQHRAYSRTVRDVAQANDHPGVIVASGRGKGMLRGCVVVLAVDAANRRVLDARSMTGSTVLARFHSTPVLLGPLRSAPERAVSRWMTEAVQHAAQQCHDTRRTRAAGRHQPVRIAA
ncbi:hypothetical protein GCM10009793_29950 [Brachybacterium phenoliresistens]